MVTVAVWWWSTVYHSVSEFDIGKDRKTKSGDKKTETGEIVTAYSDSSTSADGFTASCGGGAGDSLADVGASF